MRPRLSDEPYDDDFEEVDPSQVYYLSEIAEAPEHDPELPKLSAPIGLTEVLEAMGKEPTKTAIQALRRQIHTKELLIQNKFLVQRKRRGKYTTTLGALQRYMPELFFESADDAATRIMRALREEIADLKANDSLLMETISSLSKRLAKLERRQTTSNGVTP